MKRHHIFLAGATLLAAALPAIGAERYPGMKHFVDSLMSEMTLQEKIGQLNLCGAGDIYTGPIAESDVASRLRKGEVGGILNLKDVNAVTNLQNIAVEDSRLGIPLLVGLDVIHGYVTVFPIPLGISCSWDMEAIEESARIAAQEASADGINWTFSPMVDISRDARWGRMSEGSGEDVLLGSRIAQAMVKGYQGSPAYASPENIMACVKHVALYGAPEAGRDYNTVDMSRLRMFNEYLPPYKAAIDAGVGSAMSSFNVVDGIPATGNRWLLTDLLRDQWGFDGFVVSDASSVAEMVVHGMGNRQDVSDLALNAGLDMDLGSECYMQNLATSVEQKRISPEQIDLACRRILEAKYKLGLFADPYKYCDTSRPAKQIYTRAHRDAARSLAAKSMVLLKNEGNILPLKKSGKIALIGPILNDTRAIQGTWSFPGQPERYTSILDAFRNAVGNKAEILYARGCAFADGGNDWQVKNYVYDKEPGFRLQSGTEADTEEALRVAREADVVVAFLGEHEMESGESSSRTDLSMSAAQRQLLEKLLATGKPVVLVYFMGRPTVLDWESRNVPAILNAWFPGSEAGDALADVIFGDVNPSGKLTASFPRSVGQIPIHYDELPTGRRISDGNNFAKFTSSYIDGPSTPLYPFGYGLSYTDFSYSPMKLSSETMAPGDSITVTVGVTNTGARPGDEIVQLYIRDIVGSVSRPVKQLKDFARISLKAGETKDVTFTITPEQLKFYNSSLNYVAEPGDFEVMVGPNSAKVETRAFRLNAE